MSSSNRAPSARSLTQAEASRIVRREAAIEDVGLGDAAPEVLDFAGNGGGRLSRERESALVGIYGRLGNVLQGYLQAKLKTTVDVAVTQSEIVTFVEYQASIGGPCSVFHFDLGAGMSGGDGMRGVVDIGMRIPMLLVEVQYGGRAAGAIEAKRQALTVIEQQSVRGLVDRFTGALQDVWSQHVLFTPAGVRYEGSPEALEIMDRSEPVLVTYFDVAAKEGLGPKATDKETVSIAIPTRAIEAFLSDRGREATAASVGMPFLAAIGQRLMEASVTVRAVTPASRLTAGDLLRLQVGSVVGLGIAPDGPEVKQEILVQGQLLMHGKIEAFQGRYQALVTNVLPGPPLRPPASIPRATILGVHLS